MTDRAALDPFAAWAEKVREDQRREREDAPPKEDYFLSPTWYALRGLKP